MSEQPKAKPWSARAHMEWLKEQDERDLAQAEAEAAASGKEAFDYAKLSELMGWRDNRFAARESYHRKSYYISHREMRTLQEFADLLRELEKWE